MVLGCTTAVLLLCHKLGTASIGALATDAKPIQHGTRVAEKMLDRLPWEWRWTESSVHGLDDKDSLHFTDSLLFMGTGHSGATAKANTTGAQLAEATRARQARVKGLNLKNGLSPRGWFAITFSFAFVIKGLCMLSNVLFQISPIPQVLKFNKHRDTGEADAAPFISILYGGCQWCFYGFFAFVVTHKSGFLVLVYSNVAGAVLGIYYVWGFQVNCRNVQSLQKLFMYYKLVSVLVLTQMAAMLLLEKQQALFFSGLVSSICSVVGACSLLATLPEVLETRCSASINVPLLTVGVFSGLLWLACGFILWDAWIAVPNMLCLFIQCLAIGVVLYYPRDPAHAAAPAGLVLGTLSADLDEAPQLATLAMVDSTAVTGPAVQDYGSLRILGETGGTF